MEDGNIRFTFDDDLNNYARIKVVGVGGAGGNAINRMIEAGLVGVEFLAINTDAQVLETNRAGKKIQIGKRLTKGLGAGANPDIGRRAIEEDRDEISEILSGADMVFIAAGMGGGTGTGAAPVVAEIARQQGALTVAIVTRPFTFEGQRRLDKAEKGLKELQEKSDTLISIANDRLIEIVDETTTLTKAFIFADEVLHQATKGISDLITIPGLINCDFADVRTVMMERGEALMSTGYGEGEGRAEKAGNEAISSPLLENVSISGARGVLINVTGGDDMTLFDVNRATSIIYKAAGADANIIFGAVIDPSMNNKMRVTVIATGFGSVSDRPAEKEEEIEVIPRSQPGKVMSLFPEEAHFAARKVAGAGGNNGGRNRMPAFEDDNRQIPAYIRRLEDN